MTVVVRQLGAFEGQPDVAGTAGGFVYTARGGVPGVMCCLAYLLKWQRLVLWITSSLIPPPLAFGSHLSILTDVLSHYDIWIYFYGRTCTEWRGPTVALAPLRAEAIGVWGHQLGNGPVESCLFALASFPFFGLLHIFQGSVLDSLLLFPNLTLGSFSCHAITFTSLLTASKSTLSSLLWVPVPCHHLPPEHLLLCSQTPFWTHCLFPFQPCNPDASHLTSFFVPWLSQVWNIDIIMFISLLHSPYHLAARPGTYIYLLCNLGQVT